MIRYLLTVVLLLSIIVPTAGQYEVLDISELTPDATSKIVPDVKGKVLVSTTSLRIDPHLNQQDTVTVFPLWPKSETGYNERGGIYCNLDQDEELEVLYTVGQSLHAYNIDGSDVPGWPRMLDYYPDGAPAFGDIDGDGFGEIVVTTHQLGSFAEGKVYAFEVNGSNVFGFPFETNGGAVRTPVLADLDLDGDDEIILAVRNWPDGFIHVYHGNGSAYEGWPVRMNDVPGTAVAVGDITGDDIPEIVAQSYTALYAYNPDGSIVPGFPFLPGDERVFSHSSPVLADLDSDGLREIIFGDHSSSNNDGLVHVLKSDGTNFPNWPKETEWWIYSPPSVGDINGDGDLDIVIADYFHEIATPVNRVYAWDALTGLDLPGFPIAGVYGVFNQLLLADVDGDNEVEIIFDSNIGPEGFYCGYNHDGTEMQGWPVKVIGSSFTINPFIADLNLDGITDFSGGGHDQNLDRTWLYLWNTNSYMNPDKNYLTILQYNTRHNGVYGDYLMVGEKENELHSVGLSVFPNPARDYIYLNYHGLSEDRNVNASISDLNGRLINNISLQGTNKLQLHGFSPGVYLLSVKSLESQPFVKKIIISNH